MPRSQEGLTKNLKPTRTFIFDLADRQGFADAAWLYDVGDAVGYSTTQIRLSLRRMAEAGLLVIDGRGRRAQITLTEQGLGARNPDMAWMAMVGRADAGLDNWDGLWHLAAFEIPEGNRPGRDALRTQIVELNGGQLARSLYLSPYDWEPWLDAVAEQHGIADCLSVFRTEGLRHAGTTDPHTIAAALWPLETTTSLYTSFLRKWEELSDDYAGADPVAAATVACEMSADLAAILRDDPYLPADMTAEDFPGPAARQLALDITNALATTPQLANTHLMYAYREGQETALSMTAEEFWPWLLERTLPPPLDT